MTFKRDSQRNAGTKSKLQGNFVKVRLSWVAFITAIIVVLTVAGIFKTSNVHSKTLLRNPAALSSSRDPNVDFEFIAQLARKKSTSSIENLLKGLPENYRYGYSLVNTSQSIQEASLDNPRVIMSGLNGAFPAQNDAIISFNGNVKQHGFNEVEVIQWREKAALYEFRSISFNHGRATISEKNPIKCMGCHTRGISPDPFPIWNSYSNWPGVYGGNDEQIKNGSTEDFHFRKFKENASIHPRYKYLPRLDNIDFSHNKSNDSTGAQSVPGYYLAPAVDGPDTLSQFLAVTTTKRLLRMIRDSKNYSNLKNLLFCSIYGLGDQPWRVSEAARDLERLSLMQQGYNNAVIAQTSESTEFKLDDIRHDTSIGFDDDRYLFWVAHNIFGVQTEVISSSPQSKFMIFEFPGGGSVSSHMSLTLKEQNDQDAALYLSLNKTQQSQTCSQLFNLYQQNKEGVCPNCEKTFVPSGLIESKFINPAFNKCISCHSTGAAPTISFLDTSDLKRQLQNGLLEKIKYRLSNKAAQSGQKMPPNATLTPQDKINLIKYVSDLANDSN